MITNVMDGIIEIRLREKYGTKYLTIDPIQKEIDKIYIRHEMEHGFHGSIGRREGLSLKEQQEVIRLRGMLSEKEHLNKMEQVRKEEFEMAKKALKKPVNKDMKIEKVENLFNIGDIGDHSSVIMGDNHAPITTGDHNDIGGDSILKKLWGWLTRAWKWLIA